MHIHHDTIIPHDNVLLYGKIITTILHTTYIVVHGKRGT